jgi:FkbM family methyltransferase
MTDNHSYAGRSLVRAVKNAVLQIARRFGVYVTRDPAWLAYEDQLRRILSTLKINCVLDVGSYHGDFARLLRRLGYAGLIFSFEPVAANFEALEEARGDDRLWRTHRLALGAVSGEALIQVFAGTTFHSFLQPSEYGLARFPDKLQLERTEMVRVERLDNILDELLKDVDQPRVFLKIDTQGYDLDVIRGLGAKSNFIAALQIETAVNPIYQHVTNSFVDAVAYLQPLGFQVFGLLPVTFHSENMIQVVEFDCLMCRAENHTEST